jgi:hypothetical protein
MGIANLVTCSTHNFDENYFSGPKNILSIVKYTIETVFSIEFIHIIYSFNASMMSNLILFSSNLKTGESIFQITNSINFRFWHLILEMKIKFSGTCIVNTKWTEIRMHFNL